MAVVDVITYGGTQDNFAWRYPSDELGTWTQVVVNESHEAVFYKGGQALDLLGPGRHTLDTANIPVLRKLINLPFGGQSPFKAELWYINKTHSLDIKWGTPTPIQLQDPKYNVFIPLRAFGQFGVQITDSKVFLQKLVGTVSTFDKETLLRYFRGLYLTHVKDAISTYLIKKNISLLEINAYLREISEFLKEAIAPAMQEYGISVLNFFVNDINVPDDDAAVKKLKDALAKRAEMDIVGYSYSQERSFDTLEGAAKNPGGSAGLMGAGMGIGMGVGIGGAMGREFGELSSSITTSDTKKCPSCNASIGKDHRFCPSCGQDTVKTATAGLIACSACGCKYSAQTKFCPECGDKYIPCAFCQADLLTDGAACPICGKAQPLPCPKCGASLAGAPKFCPECGESTQAKCPGCGVALDGSVKFCPECGQKL